MKIELRRYRHKTETRCTEPVEVIDGELYIDGTKICDTAENACHCLPKGSYPLAIIKCHQHGRKMPLIMVGEPPASGHCKKLGTVCNNTNMPRFCPQLCPGNGVYNRTDGAIILGTYLVPGCLIHPKDAFDSLYDRIRKSAERGHDITLVISSVSKNHLSL